MPDTDTTDTETPRTFTQEEVDHAVSSRLARFRAKYEDYDDIKSRLAAHEAGGNPDSPEVERLRQERDDALAELETLQTEALHLDLRVSARAAGLDPVGTLDALTGTAAHLLNTQDIPATLDRLRRERPSLVVAKKPRRRLPGIGR